MHKLEKQERFLEEEERSIIEILFWNIYQKYSAW